MDLNKLALIGTMFFSASPIWATTYWGGVEDKSGPQADYDYNDLVFSISGTTLNLASSAGSWFNETAAGVLNTGIGASGLSGMPFWNNKSLDGAGGLNVGWCIYGGGACNGGSGFAPTDLFLATALGQSVNDVYFSVGGDVTEEVTSSLADATDALGWQLRSGGPIHLFGTGVQGPATFSPGGDFVLVASRTGGMTFATDATASDGISHFAFFGPASVPEPSTIASLSLGFGVVLGSLALRRRRIGPAN